MKTKSKQSKSKKSEEEEDGHPVIEKEKGDDVEKISFKFKPQDVKGDVEKDHSNSTQTTTTRNGTLSSSSSSQPTKTISKRQRLKQVNNKHALPQQPRITSPTARAKAYLRVSGLTQTLKEQIDVELDLHSPSLRFGRLLASPDQRVRHKAVLQLQAYLKARCDINGEARLGISELDLLKLWKGLWHTLYMCDKVPVQEELSGQLASLIWCVAGTEEEDEYAGQAYMNLYGGPEGDGFDDDDDDDNDDDENMDYEDSDDDNDDKEQEDVEESVDQIDGDGQEEDQMKEGDSDDDSDVVIQGIVRRYDDKDHDDDEENNDEDDEDQKEVIKREEVGNAMEEEAGSIDPELPHCRGAHLASLFVRTFLLTVRREWGRMDKYRVDKFYTLIRRVMHQVYKYTSLRHWNLGIIRLFNDAIFEEALSKTPNGLRYHLIDLTLEELALVHTTAPMPLTEATFVDCLEPYFAMAQTGVGDDSIQRRVVENIMEKFLDKYSVVSEVAQCDKSKSDTMENGDQESKALIFDQVHVGTISQFIFDLASDLDTPDTYRKSLYDLHKKYVRRLKVVDFDVDLQASVQMGDEEEDYNIDSEEAEKSAMDDENGENEGDEDNDNYAMDEEVVGQFEGSEYVKKLRKTDNSSNVEVSGETEDKDEPKRTKKKEKKKKKVSKGNDSEKKSDNDHAPQESTEPQSVDDEKSQTRKDEQLTEDMDTPDKSACQRKLFEAQGGSVEEGESARGKKRKRKKKRKEIECSTKDEVDVAEKLELDPRNRRIDRDAEGDASSKENNDNIETSEKKTKTSNTRLSVDSSESEELTGTPDGRASNGKKKSKKNKEMLSNDGDESGERDGLTRQTPSMELRNDAGEKAEREKLQKTTTKKSRQANKEDEEEEVVISIKDQEKAKSVMNARTNITLRVKGQDMSEKGKGTKSKEELASLSESKRVKFEAVNRARSFSASMKALRSANPSTPPVVPEQSILLNKTRTPRLNVKKLKKRRRKATHYF